MTLTEAEVLDFIEEYHEEKMFHNFSLGEWFCKVHKVKDKKLTEADYKKAIQLIHKKYTKGN